MASDPRAPGLDAADTAVLLAAARGGDRAAHDQVFARVYEELRRVASRHAARLGRNESLATTALVHEAYLKLATHNAAGALDRSHFFALAARAMRQILIDHARHRGRDKRGGGAVHLDVVGLELAHPTMPIEEVLALDSALERLRAVDDELHQLVEWRFFSGLTLEEISGLTGTSERTLKRDWQVARAFLLRALAEPGGDGPPLQGGREGSGGSPA